MLVDKKEVSQNDFEAATYKIKESLIQINELRLSDEEFRKKTNSISQYGKLIDLYIATSDVLPEIFGYDSEKKYILVFQNNNELRPGGGFIGSFGLVSAKNGIYSEPEIHDVYEADGQLRGQIDPPLFLKKYMGITNWFLRDSNTEVDNIKNAENISRFTNLEMGEDVDGVITVDLNVIRGLLDITGPIEIEGYGKVTSENFDEFSQSLIQDNFFPGSKLKGTYLNDFSSALGKKLSVSQMSGVFKSLNDSLVNKSLTIVFKDENLQDPLTLYNVSSSPYMKRGKVGISNFTGINEANLSANKANNKIVRAIKHDIQVTNTGIVKNILNISLKNNSSVENDFEGIYKVYLRFLVPEGANVTSININGKDQIILAPITDPKEYEARGAIPENNIEVDRVNLGDLSSYGIYQEIGLGETNDINFTYELPDPLDLRSGEISLTNQIFMQPGTLDDSYTFVFRNPEGFTSKSSNKNLKTTSTGVYGVFKLNRDEDFNIKLNRS